METNLFLVNFILLICILSNCQAETVFNCYPEPNPKATQELCEARNCTWKPNDKSINAPSCYFKDGVGYKLDSQEGITYNLVKNSGPANPWGPDLREIKMTTKTYGSILNVKIGLDGRYEPPVDFPQTPASSPEVLTLQTESSTDVFSFSVIRESSNQKIFDTSIGGLIFSDQFIQLATYLPSENMYGWGENTHQTLKHDFSKYLTWAMFARDQPPESLTLNTVNLYGVHPYYMVVEPDGKTHGVLILNSNAQEITTAPGPSIIYRTIGGNLDIYFFPGPTPEQVTQQYLQFIGLPFLPAYWSLGYQISRYGYDGLDAMKERIAAVRDAGIPLDIGVADIDYMDKRKDFTTGENWSGLGDYVKQMHEWGMKLILIFDPAIDVNYPSFERAIAAKAKFIEWENEDQVPRDVQKLYPFTNDTKIMLGVVWPDYHVGFPDFFDQNTQDWWRDEFAEYYKQVEFDGLWIDMNEPANFGTNDAFPWYYGNISHPTISSLICPTNDSKWEMPPYKTQAVWKFGDEENGAYLSSNTLCLNGVQANGKYRFYDIKSLYGWSEARATQQGQFKATGKRGAVISRSTFPSAGRFAGHWLGDNTARWEDLRTSVIGVQEFNLFGIPYVGSDVCGFFDETTEELCLRWQQLGAFHSFFRNHNNIDIPSQDPAVWPSVTAASIKANLFRYQYLPYLFSLHFLSSMNGSSVIHPVFFDYPTDSKTYNLDYQFMWGSSILVAPVVYQGTTSVDVYLPDDIWYSLSDYKYGSIISPGNNDIPSPTTSLIPVFVRGGSVIPRQTPAVTTTATRANPFELLIAPCKMGHANGFLYWDDGDSIVESFESHDYHHFDFKFSSTIDGGVLNINHTKTSSIKLPSLDIIEVFNCVSPPDFGSFKLNGASVDIDVKNSVYDATTKRLYISTVGLINLNSHGSTVLEWSNDASVSTSRPQSFYHCLLVVILLSYVL